MTGKSNDLTDEEYDLAEEAKSFSRLGTIAVHKESTLKFINKEDLNYWLEEGGCLGGAARSEEHKRKISATLMGHEVSESTRQKISTINKGKVESEEMRKKISDSLIGIPKSEETKQKMSQTQSSMTFITNGVEVKHIYKEDLDYWLNKGGGIEGRLSCKEETKQKIGKRNSGGLYMNNGVITKHVKDEDIDLYKAEGWVVGWAPRKHREIQRLSSAKVNINKCKNCRWYLNCNSICTIYGTPCNPDGIACDSYLKD